MGNPITEQQYMQMQGMNTNDGLYTSYSNNGFMPTTNTNGYTPDVGSGTGGLFDNWSGQDMVGGAMGIANVGLGLANFFENKDFNKARVKGINEQIKNSKYTRNRHKEFVGNTRSAFGA